MLAAGESYKELFDNVQEHIHDEDDSEIRAKLLMKLSNILSAAKTETTKMVKLKHFRAELLDTNLGEEDE